MKSWLLSVILFLSPGCVGAQTLDGITDGKPVVIAGSHGGRVDEFQRKALDLMASKTPVIVAGECASACTILVDMDRANVCITTDAILEFHKAVWKVLDVTVHTANINYETPGLNAYIQSRGGLPDPDDANLLIMGFDQLKHFFRPCPGAI